MRHSEKKGGRFLGSQKLSQTVSFREHARVPPDAHRAQGHETHWTGRQKGGSRGLSICLIFSNRLTRLRPSRIRRKRRIIPLPSSLSSYQAPCAPTRKAHETHREEKERFSEERKISQTVSFREHARVPPDAHHANRHETFWTGRQKGEPEGLSNRLIFSNRLTRLKPSHVPRKRRVGTLPSSLRRRPTPSPVVGEGWGEDARPPHEAKPPTRTRRIRGHTRTTCYNPQYTLRNGDPRP